MKLERILDRVSDIARLDLEPTEGSSKVLSLDEAIRQHVRPGMTIYIREATYGAVREIIRQYWDQRPEFTVVMMGCRDYAIDLLHRNLVNRLITSRCSESATQGISPVVEGAYREGSVRIENWSLYSLTLRLVAGAMGLGFLPTHSLLGSTMAEENRDAFLPLEDPFDGGGRVGLVRSLEPDVALVHGWASDPNGNVILAPAILSGEGAWGALASRNGVIATVEMIVSTDFVRRHALRVAIPAPLVTAVSPVPFGAHPLGLLSVGEAFDEYEADYEFMRSHGEASRDPAALDAWLKEWVLDCPDQEAYLRKLGYSRLAFLRGKAGRFPWEHKILSLSEALLARPEYDKTERMIVAASRIVRDKILDRGYRIVLSGIGTAGQAAWLACYRLKKQGVDVDMMLGSGAFGWSPRPGDPRLTSFASLRTCKMLTDILHAYGVFARRGCLSVLGAAQIDRYGNLNTTRLSDDAYLAGSGGANDALAAADEAVVVLSQSRRRFVEKLPYVTCCGRRVRTVVSDKGVYEKVDPEGELVLTGYFLDSPSSDKEQAVRAAIETCGWTLRVGGDLRELGSPTEEELALLRILSAKP